MIRVVMVHQYDPTQVTQVGGVEVFINTFAKYAPEDMELRIVGITSDEGAHCVGRWHPISLAGRRVAFLPVLAGRPGRGPGLPLSAKLTWALIRSRRQLQLDNAVVTFNRIEPSLPARTLGVPSVLILHSHSKDLHNPHTEVTWRKAPRLHAWLEARLIGGVARVFMVRQDAVADYRRRYPRLASRMQFLPTCVDDELFVCWDEARRAHERRMLAEEHGLEAGRRWLLFVGRFEAAKDPMLMLQTMRILADASTQLVMLGRGALERQMRDYIAQHRLESRVRLLGPQPHGQLVRWLNAADCLCMSSAFEGMPLAMLEALHCGLPVVSTAASGETLRILERPAGLVVAKRTADALARGVRELLFRAPDRAACRAAAAPYAARTALGSLYQKYREIHAGNGR